ncbi:MAG: AMP-binding protein [Proteobacteria bacterium]|nr:AMP-binding protein [Pseudomonadota bacterium]
MNNICDYSSVYDAFKQCSKRFRDNAFLRAPPENTADSSTKGVFYTYGETSARVNELIPNYAARGLRKGERVALVFDSRLEVYLHLLALNALGVSIVPLHSLGTDGDLYYMIEHSNCRLAVVAEEHRTRLESLLADLDDCNVVGESDLEGSSGPHPRVPTDPATEAALVYTSGTTGKPKGCMLSNEYFLAIGNWYTNLGGICSMDANDRLLTPLPPNHMNALCTSFTAMMLCGGCVVQVDRFHPRSWWQSVREEKATIIHCLGVMIAILLTLPEDAANDFSGQIKFCFGPGSDPRHQAIFEKRFGFPLIDAWAMTETGAGGLTIAHEEPRHVGERCIGKPAESTEYRIVDEKDVDVAAGESGELLVRAQGDRPRRNFFSGYYKDVAATEEGWQGGWWHTGDVVREGPDGSLFFVDRRKNVIRRSGENIAAVEVEAALLQSPQVNNCAVCAVADEIRGDEVFAFVIPNDSAADAGEIFRHCVEHLTYFKTPGYIAFVDTLPLTASQKVSRGEVKKMAAERVANNDCVDLRKLKKR